MSFYTVLVLWVIIAALAMGCLGVAIAYTIRLMRLPDACRYRDLAARIATKTAELADSTARLDEARAIITQSDQARKELIATEEWMAKNKDLLLTLQAERQEQAALQGQIGTLQEELSTKRSELDRVASERATSQAVVDGLKQEHLNLTGQMAATTAELREATLGLQKTRAEATQADVQLESLRRTITEQQHDVDLRRTTIAELTKQHDGLIEQIRMSQLEMRTAVAESTQAKQQAEVDKVALVELQKQLKTVSEYIDRLSAESKNLAARRDDLAREAAAAQEAAGTAASERDRVREEVTALTGERAALLADVAGLRGTRDATQKEVDQLHASLTSIQESIAAAQDKTEELRREHAALTARKEELQRAIVASEKAAAAADDLRAKAEALLNTTRTEHQALKGEVAALTGTRDGLNSEIKELRELVADLRGVLKEKGGDTVNRYKDLWEPLTSFSLIKSDAAREQAALENTQRHLGAVGLSFPPRVLNAFHTALKTADMSPLVVLAGISGTGKSQLPKRYAEGMGINFVSLAVQPRWDSPQDLFGFFNHLEKRYKATELARAMVQFERHTWKHWPDAQRKARPQSEQMLMVLLDEMNLARVEYYFSEFLSRLEYRRDVKDPRDDKSRAQTEIRLDMGALGEGEREILLYPDRNILFTGTMNEDESTQTLSDKVLDRAGVLRFGRPRTLVTKASGGKTVDEQYKTKNAISLDQWMSWGGRPLSQGGGEQIGGWIAKLNDCMDQLHRPFAHRVAQAMQQYVVNYPAIDIDERTRLMWAMSDQIEQRILPKLRGIDLEEHKGPLDGIGKLIDAVGDGGLKTAYESCRNGSIFMWRGLDRTA